MDYNFQVLLTVTGVFVYKGCTNQADVIFVLDSSGSIEFAKFELIKSFVSTLVNSFNVEGGAVRVGLLTFSDNVQPMFNLSQHTTRSSIKVGS